MTRPSIFISHSCKDKETAPPVGLSPAEADGRAGRLAFARDFRDRLVAGLDPGRYDVWLDVRGGLEPGDVWREAIHEALARCEGAVVLLTPESIESGWVLKEATILSWRAFLA